MHAPPEHAELLVAVADELTRVREGIDHVEALVSRLVRRAPAEDRAEALTEAQALDALTQGEVGKELFAVLDKAGVVPLHGWLPRAYPATSATVFATGAATPIASVAIPAVWPLAVETLLLGKRAA